MLRFYPFDEIGWIERSGLLSKKHVITVIVLSPIGLLGCAQDDPHLAYQDAVGRVLERSVLPQDPVQQDPVQQDLVQQDPERLRYPSQRQLMVDIPASRIDWVQFAQLHSCDLGALIGARNSARGRVRQASVALAYEVEWLRLAETCSGFDWLDAAIAEKRAHLPVHVWNSTFAGPEMAQAMSLAGGAIGNHVCGIQTNQGAAIVILVHFV